jgi:uncharacterized membrane protein YdjX (TVP38/TMEM64 family)
MKTSIRHYGLLALLLVGLSVPWLRPEVCRLDAATHWVQHLGSRGPFMLVGLYGLAPTLHLRGGMPAMAGTALCTTILGMVMILMGTTIGIMVTYLLVRSLAGVWRGSRVTSLLSAVPSAQYKGSID